MPSRKTTSHTTLMIMEKTEQEPSNIENDAPAESAEAPSGLLVDRERPRRRPLIPRSLLAGILGLTAVLALAIAVGTWYVSGIGILVPDITGLPEGVARARLAQVGLGVSTVERRFDVQPEGTVLAQNPSEGARLSRGGTVALVVSAGTEEFVMPDVVGQGINVARAQLEQRGLVVKIEAVDSDQPSDTVLETIPAAGAIVRTSDIVRVRIASDGSASTALLPFALQGTVFVIDPEPPQASDVDPAMEVARRLRSLLEASGARVVITRSVTEADVSLATRAQRAAETTPLVTAAIGLDVVLESPVGLGVLVPGEGTLLPPQVQASDELAVVLVGILAEQERRVSRGLLVSDPVAAAASAPTLRVRLGALDSREDVAAFRDPTWSDTIARAIYRALGEQFARP